MQLRPAEGLRGPVRSETREVRPAVAGPGQYLGQYLGQYSGQYSGQPQRQEPGQPD